MVCCLCGVCFVLRVDVCYGLDCHWAWISFLVGLVVFVLLCLDCGLICVDSVCVVLVVCASWRLWFDASVGCLD